MLCGKKSVGNFLDDELGGKVRTETVDTDPLVLGEM
jgi:hypothetical protein